VLATALFTLVSLGSPVGRASTAQGIYGASGTVALIVASLAAGVLWESNSSWPFWFFVAGMAISLALGLLIYYGPRMRRSSPPLAEGAA
jgi:MFS family permease